MILAESPLMTFVPAWIYLRTSGRRLHAGACHHALGSHLEAVKDYESAFSMVASELGEDARSRQFLTFYQREMALYARGNADRPVEDYCLDHDLHPVFKASAAPAPDTCAAGLLAGPA